MSAILIVEDDPRIQKALERQFLGEGFEVHIVGDGLRALDACNTLHPTAVVLDLMLPGLSGREICRALKTSFPHLPVVILSAVSDVADKVLLLEMGADDYVTKPFSPRELLARVQAAIRRSSKNSPDPSASAPPGFSFGTVTADFLRMELRRNGVLVPLTAHEFKLLR